ncbi:hypothetical protein [Saccharopolyspora erythraea]|uniref:hypothetical protein n=1 Tax=Saccharopolyspora erythraea TaxID=1836 RepID=UPI001BABDBDE|nr:hypothetical protein [Saccharopolyspora erythraea]
MSTPTGEGSGPAGESGGGQPESPSTTEAAAPPEGSADSSEPPADASTAKEGPPADGSKPDESAGGAAEPTPESTPTPEPAGDGEKPAGSPPEGDEPSTRPDTPGDPGSDSAAQPGDDPQKPEGPESSGQEPPAEGDEGDVPGIIPGAEVTERSEADVPGLVPGAEVVPKDDDFKARVRAQAPAIETPTSILDDIGQEWRNTGGDADAARSEGGGGMDAVIESWNDPALDDMRRRTDPSLDETRNVSDSARAMDEQVQRANAQARAAADGMERNTERQAPGYYLATATLPPGEREVAAQQIVDITAAGNRDIAHQAANNITNDPGWAGIETSTTGKASPPHNPEAITGADILANAGYGIAGWQAAQSWNRKADFWSKISNLHTEYGALKDGPEGLVHQKNALRTAAEATRLSQLGKIADLAGKYAGPVAGLPLAILGAQNDIASGESPAQAYGSNLAGWGTGFVTGLAIGASVGGPVGAVLGAIGGAAASAVTSGMVDNWVEHGSVAPQPAQDHRSQT